MTQLTMDNETPSREIRRLRAFCTRSREFKPNAVILDAEEADRLERLINIDAIRTGFQGGKGNDGGVRRRAPYILTADVIDPGVREDAEVAGLSSIPLSHVILGIPFGSGARVAAKNRNVDDCRTENLFVYALPIPGEPRRSRRRKLKPAATPPPQVEPAPVPSAASFTGLRVEPRPVYVAVVEGQVIGEFPDKRAAIHALGEELYTRP
ncbi:MAG TPA: hypothetical protein VM285_04780 [Polyangia bacterium]|nr:hypothetical protein [Polyangia bacterium]